MKISPIILVEIEVEMNAARAMHSPLPILNPVRAAGLLCEEVLEVMTAALDATREPVTGEKFDGGMHKIRDELRQVAAMAIVWMMEMDKLTNEGEK